MLHLTLGLKLNEIGVGSTVLAYILYSDPFTYTLDGDGNTLMTNKGSFDDAEVFSGSGVELGATNELSIPIEHTLGTDSGTSIITSGDVIAVNNLDGTYTVSSAGVSTGYLRFRWSPPNPLGQAIFSTNVTVNSGTCTLSDIPLDSTTTFPVEFTGEQEFYIDNISTVDSNLLVYATIGDVFNITLSFTVKQITTEDSFLTLVNSDGTVSQIGNMVDGGSSDDLEIVVNGDFSNETTGWTNHDTYWKQPDASMELIPLGSIAILSYDIIGSNGKGVVHTGLKSLESTKQYLYPSAIGSYRYAVKAISAAQSITLYSISGTLDVLANFDNVSLRIILPNSKTYTLTDQTVLEATLTTKQFTTADLALIEADTSLMGRLNLGATDTGLSLVTADMFGHYAFMEYSGADCIDTKDGVTTATITNYVETIRTNIDFNPKGVQGVAFERDAAGVPTDYNNTQLNWYGDGYVDVQFNPSLQTEFIIEESVGLVFYSHIYDGVNLTTWTDGVEGTPTAHTPENANYLLGKGVYPKVTADPYTTYVQDYFEVILDAGEIANYDALQACNDYISATYSVLTDESGTPLTDANGVYLYE